MRTLIQALKTKELRKKILFVLFIIIVYRIGSFKIGRASCRERV